MWATLFRSSTKQVMQAPLSGIWRAYSNNPNSVKIHFAHVRPEAKRGMDDSRYDPTDLHFYEHYEKTETIHPAYLAQQVPKIMDGIHFTIENLLNHQNKFKLDGDTIVRLSTPEFAFGTSAGPIPEETFLEKIYDPLMKTASKLPSWLRLHLGTFLIRAEAQPIHSHFKQARELLKDLWEESDPRVFNTAIIGPTYSKTGEKENLSIYSKQLTNHSNSYSGIPWMNDAQKSYPDKLDQEQLHTDNVVLDHTANGTPFTTVFGICLDAGSRRALPLRTLLTRQYHEHQIFTDLTGTTEIVSNTIGPNPDEAPYTPLSHHDQKDPAVLELDNEGNIKGVVPISSTITNKTNVPFLDGKIAIYPALIMQPAQQIAEENFLNPDDNGYNEPKP